MRPKAIHLVYKGKGVFTTREKVPIRKGQILRIQIKPTPITDATRGIIKVSPKFAKLADAIIAGEDEFLDN